MLQKQLLEILNKFIAFFNFIFPGGCVINVIVISSETMEVADAWFVGHLISFDIRNINVNGLFWQNNPFNRNSRPKIQKK